jgi:hypothetical protein
VYSPTVTLFNALEANREVALKKKKRSFFIKIIGGINQKNYWKFSSLSKLKYT